MKHEATEMPVGANHDSPEHLPNSNAVRLSAWQWLMVSVVLLALLALAPTAWKRIERFEPSSVYRLPYAFGSDYWLYARHANLVNHQQRIPVIGDSVIWGHYVRADQTLCHYLNDTLGREQFANLGLDGTHPAALRGLVEHYAGNLAGRAVVLHFNPLWITSAKHDLQTEKEFHFNHPKLVPQFSTKIPCYKAPFSERLRILVGNRLPLLSWTAHLRIAYFGGTDLQRWTLQHPYTNPLGVLTSGLPKLRNAAPEQSTSWLQRGAKTRDINWVELDRSLQWLFFRETVERLKARGCQVFVLVGPFNEHMLNEASRAAYVTIKTQIEAWLAEAQVPHLVASALPSELYADTSHPLAEGYALLAQQLLETPAFQTLTSE